MTTGYVPNPAARSLVTRRSDTVALVISEPSTVHQPTEQMGCEMARLLGQQITGEGPLVVHEVLPARPVVRASS